MWKSLFLAGALASTALAQNPPTQFEFANLREDVRGLTQRLGELSLKFEQLERENADLRSRVGAASQSYASMAQLNEALADVNRRIQAAVASSRSEILQQVAGQLEKLGQQTNAALESLARAQTPRLVSSSTATATTDGGSKDGAHYTVQKGDTLAVIAKKTGVKQQDIIAANKLTDPDHVVVGQTLLIPGGK